MSYAIKQTAQAFYNDTAANFRVWGKAISDALAAGGLVKTADTGQIDWATVAAPAGLSAKAGYEIWRFADTLQATHPVFIRIDYGNSSVSSPRAGTFWTIGTGSNGAGVITGVLLAQLEVSGNKADATLTANWLISASTNRINLWMNYNTPAGALMVCIERTKDAVNADSSVGVMYVFDGIVGGSGKTQHQVLPFAGATPPAESGTTVGTFLIPSSGTTSDGVDVGTFPFTHFYFGKTVNPMIGLFAYRDTEILTDTIQPVTTGGVTRNYYCMGTAALQSRLFAVSRNSNTQMILHE